MTVTFPDIAAAADTIRPYIRVTPVMEVDPKDFGIAWEGRLTLKLEGQQHAGSFKPRGAFASLLTPQRETKPVVAISGGNHGAAVAFAAKTLGLKALVFVPEYAPQKKIDKIKSYGAEVRVTGAKIADTFQAYDDYLAANEARALHPYDAHLTIAGQGTLGMEWAAQTPDLDAVLVAIGGGGLIAGVAAAMRSGPAVIGVEPEGARCAFEARKQGAPVDFTPKSVAADSLGAPSVGGLNHEIIEDAVDDLVLVDDEAILAAQSALWNVCGIACEPGAATAFAALMSGAVTPETGAHIGVLICGSNVDPSTIA